MPIRLAHHDGPIHTLDVGQYCDDGGVMVVRCSCGGISRLDEHTVSASGWVSPVWACPMAGCDVADFLILEAK